MTDKKKKKNADKQRNINVFYLIGLLLIIAIIIALFVFVWKKDDSSKESNSAIDKNSASYEGKKIIEKDGNIIIEEENDSKTIESKDKDSKYILATEKIQKQYKISDIKAKNNETYTIITGKIKNIEGKYKNVYVNVKFYLEDKIAGSSSVLVKNLGRGETENFKIKTMGNFASYKYKVIVEYVG